MRRRSIAKRIVAWAAVLAVIGGTVIAVVAIRHWNTLVESDSLPREDLPQKLWWRLRLFTRKSVGGVPDLSWSELWLMTHQRGGFGLESLVDGTSADGSVVNAFNSDEDVEAGGRVFGQRCALCHGAEGVGWNAPPLNHPGLEHGDSDLAIYKVLRDGIAGTGMAPADLLPIERWQVVAYLKTVMIHGAGRRMDDDGPALSIHVSHDQVRSAGSKTDEWLTYSGSMDGQRYTPLSQITKANVADLRSRWIQQFNTSERTIEATPLVVDGAIFTTEPPAAVVALDAKSGAVAWRYDRSISPNLTLCCGRVNRGLAILGDKLFLGSLDGYLVAIDANTGNRVWQTQVADPSAGYTMTGAPLAVNQSIVVGVAGGEFGIRGFLAAYDPKTGQQQWKFDTVPGPGQPGHETWESDAWRTGGGATWITGSYDPELDLLYWGVGNPAPDYSGDTRPGDNLFTNSVIALHGSTGTLAWHFQFSPHDEHDWDSTQTPVLVDAVINGVHRKVICWANRNGFYYVLDRVTGEFLTGVPFVEQNWAKGLDSKGRPILTDGSKVSNSGRLTKPGFEGGTNWQNTALDKKRGLIFVHATESASVFTKAEDFPEKTDSLRAMLGSGASSPEPPRNVVRALDFATGKIQWEYFPPSTKEALKYTYSGLLATGGGLVFGAEGGSAFALDSDTGKELWRVFLGGDTRAAPISFTVDGRQVVAISAGRSLYLFELKP